MARFAPNFAYTLSGSTLTLDAAAQEDARYIFYYSYADINQTSGHSHAKDVRGGGWAGGTSWTLSHRPDGDEKLLLVEDLGAAFWAMYRLDSGNGTFYAPDVWRTLYSSGRAARWRSRWDRGPSTTTAGP
jgi:hypothetical protein